MNILAKTLHGSRLYRLNGPKSDVDWATIHLPPVRDCLLLRAARNIETVDESAAIYGHEKMLDIARRDKYYL